MAKIQVRRASQPYTCAAMCGRPIAVGEEYLTAKPFRAPRITAHKTCGIPRSRLTQSEFLGAAYDAEDELTKLSPDDFEDIETFWEEVERIATDAEEAAYELQGQADNMVQGPGADEKREQADDIETWAGEVRALKDEELESGVSWQEAVVGKWQSLPTLDV